jgi:hypothetical protein
MLQCHQELTLKDALSDSLIRTVMAADGVDPRELEATLTEIARNLRAGSHRRRSAPNGGALR